MKKINWQYTFGEILIVIIGITIAFSLNKCAEVKSNDELKDQYLRNMKLDIESDRQTLDANMKSIGEKLHTLEVVMPLINTNNPEKFKSINKVFSVFNLIAFYPKDITYQTMINSGDYKLINDFEMKSAIETHYSSYKSIFKDYERQEIIHRDYLGAYLMNNVDYDAMRRGEFGFKDEKLFKNILQSIMGSLIIKKNATERGIKSCDSLLVIFKHY